MDAQGTVLIPLDEEQVRAVVAQAVAQGAQAIAILFLHSYRNPGARAARQGDRSENASRSCSSPPRTSCRQEYREYERTSTAAANAYVGPRVRRYLDRDGASISTTPASAATS